MASPFGLIQRLLSTTIACAALFLITCAPASAITQGNPDTGKYPAVGAMLLPDLDIPVCSGTLISPTVYLTAAHCVGTFFWYTGKGEADVSFENLITPTSKRYHGTLYWHPFYAGIMTIKNPYDIAVLKLDKPVKGIVPSALPTAGLLDKLAVKNDFKNQKFTAVGYGDYRPEVGGAGGHQWPDTYNHTRYVGTSTFNSLTNDWLNLSQNSATNNGGTCYGDSGGPNFLGTSNVVAGTTITGDPWCRSTNVDLRMDTPISRDFLRSFVTLP